MQGPWDASTDEELYAAFRAFASFGSGTPKASTQSKALELDGKGFVKMCRDSGLTDSRLTTTAIDLIFSRVRGKVGCLPPVLQTSLIASAGACLRKHESVQEQA